MWSTILYISLTTLLICVFGSIVYGIYLYKKNRQKYNDLKGLIEYLGIASTLALTIFAIILSFYSIQGSTEYFGTVTKRFNDIISIFNSKPDLKIAFDIDPNDTTFEITNIKLKNDGDITAHVYMLKIVMPNSGFIETKKVKKPILPPGFIRVFTYNKEYDTYLSYYPLYYHPPNPPKFVLPPDSVRGTQSIDINRCEIIYDKHLNKPFKVFAYYSSLYGHDGWVDTTINIYKP